MPQNEKEWRAARRREWRAARREELKLPAYTIPEEIANAVTHGIGALLALAALVVLLVRIPVDSKAITCLSIYGGTLFLLYLISTLYHALGVTRAKKVFQVLDHCSVFLLIAGTYTPITLLVLDPVTGWTLFAVVWTAAILGIVLNSIDMKRFRVFSMICYIGMGWCVIFAFGPLSGSLSALDLWLLIGGGIAYTVGAVLYGFGKKVRYIHSLWHLFVLAGSILHFMVILHCVENLPA